MKRMFFLTIFALLICTAAGSSAQNADFQSGKIVSVETIDSNPSKGGTDAATPANLQKHDVSIELGGTIYVCRAETPKDFDISFAQGKDVQARVKGKTMYVKRENGKIAKLSILRTKTSG
jgi:hypothetical protein